MSRIIPMLLLTMVWWTFAVGFRLVHKKSPRAAVSGNKLLLMMIVGESVVDRLTVGNRHNSLSIIRFSYGHIPPIS